MTYVIGRIWGLCDPHPLRCENILQVIQKYSKSQRELFGYLNPTKQAEEGILLGSLGCGKIVESFDISDSK